MARAVFLEDDVSFDNSFVERLHGALDRLDDEYPAWDLLYLGRQQLHGTFDLPRPLVQDVSLGDGLVRPGYSF